MRLGLNAATVTLVLALLAPGPAAAAEIPAPTPPAGGELALVVDVTDGDTIRVDRGNGSSERLRYIGIDTPETVKPGAPVEAWGPEASAANEELVDGRVVLLERDVSDRDRYDRLLRYVWVEDDDGWILVNAELVARGLATVHAYEPDTKHHAYLQQVQREATDAGLGIHDGERSPDGECSPDGDLIDDILDFLFGA